MLKIFIIQDKKLLIYSLINLELDLKPFTKQKRMEQIKKTTRTGLKILTPKQMLQRLPIALAQVKAGNNSKNLLNEIPQIVYSLYQSKEIPKKVYNNIIKSIQ